MGKQPRILVLGDIMLDQYVSGNVTRISPEAPVPVVKVSEEWSTLGGAANVAANVSALGGQVALCGLIGNDAAAAQVNVLCETAGIDSELITGNQPTIVKTRVVSGQQIVRFDREEELVWNYVQFRELAGMLSEQIAKSDVILLSDYAKGTLSDAVLKLVFELANQSDIKVLIDPKREDWTEYKGAFAITPNLVELAMTQQTKNVQNEDNTIVSVCNLLRKDFSIENIIATRSSYGMTVVNKGGVLNIPTRALEVFDVSGAGDTVLAALGVNLAAGKSISESAFIANAAAGIVVSKRGTAIASRSELEAFLSKSKKLVNRDEIGAFSDSRSNQKVVFTNGCFDVLHQGHRKLLKEAKALGDCLVVGLNSDDSINRLKGETRPINALAQRVEALSSLPFVDAIMVFEEDTPYELLSELRPHVLVKGGDYEENQVVGNELVGRVHIIPLVEGVSTTGLTT